MTTLLHPIDTHKTTLPLLDIRNLSLNFRHNKENHRVVNDISWFMEKGQTLALVGESGSGKSVTALSILKLLPPTAFYNSDSRVMFQGQDLLALNDKSLQHIRGHKIAMIFQEPMTSLNPLMTVAKQIGEILGVHKNIYGNQALSNITELLEKVGFVSGSTFLGRYPHELSGGQRQRVMIAMALAGDPELLIADEPTTALDVTTQAQILSLLKDIQRQNNMGLLIITHDLNIVRTVADNVAVMRHGEIVEFNKVAALFDNPKHDYTRKLIAAEPQGSAVAMINDANTVLASHGLCVTFKPRKSWFKSLDAHRDVNAVQDVSLTIKAGETLGLVGESGSGKSTLGLALLRLQPAMGSIIFMGQDIQTLSSNNLQSLRKHMQIVFQDPFGSLSPRMTIAQIIAEGAYVHKLMNNKDEHDAAVTAAMNEVGLDPETRHRYPHEFSGGQRQRIAIARALILKPQLIILDEPTSALDRPIQNEILQLLKSLQRRYGMAYLFISHDLKVVRAISHRVMVMWQGQIVESGLTDQIFDKPQHNYTKKTYAGCL